MALNGPLQPARTTNKSKPNAQTGFFEVLLAAIRAARRASARLRIVHTHIKGKGGVLLGRRRGRTKAVVLIAPEELAVAFAAGVTLAGTRAQGGAPGAPEQLRVTAEAKPLKDVTVTIKLAVPPAVTVPCDGVRVSEKSGGPGTEPLPESVTC